LGIAENTKQDVHVAQDLKEWRELAGRHLNGRERGNGKGEALLISPLSSAFNACHTG